MSNIYPTIDVTPPSPGRRNNHTGAVLVHESGVARLVQQEHALALGWDGESPVMYLEADGTVRCVCPGRD